MPSLNACFVPLILLNSMALMGCKSPHMPATVPTSEQSIAQPSKNYIPVQRYGRYTLVELAPEAAQQNLLLQVIDIDLPSAWSISVGDALHYVLLRSGYRLCDTTPELAVLFNLPLPAAHLSLGPIVLRDALQILSGPAWALQSNEQLRQVCFTATASANSEQASATKTAPAQVNP
ncbi:PFGI-1 class ICE element type IV pilus protein PilL2 [Pseudomonas sp. RT4P38]